MISLSPLLGCNGVLLGVLLQDPEAKLARVDKVGNGPGEVAQHSENVRERAIVNVARRRRLEALVDNIFRKFGSRGASRCWNKKKKIETRDMGEGAMSIFKLIIEMTKKVAHLISLY